MISCKNPADSQDQANTMNQLFFGTALCSDVNGFPERLEQQDALTYINSIGQWNLNTTIVETAEDLKNGETIRHRFSFTENPVNHLPLLTGELTVTVREGRKLQQLKNIDWEITVEKQADGERMWHDLQQLFANDYRLTNADTTGGRWKTLHYILQDGKPSCIKSSTLSTYARDGTIVCQVILVL